MGLRRVLALLLSAMLLLTPVMTVAEAPGFSAGDLTLTTLSESYTGGYQIDVRFGFDVNTEALSVLGEQALAAAALLEMAQVNLSFYDDFGTVRVRGGLDLDGVNVVNGDMLIFEDGSVQMVTSLTNNMAFTLPAGTVTEEGINLPSFSRPKYDWQDPNELPAYERLKYSAGNMITTVINLLLGWVSGVQMETGELYTFDYETYIEETDTRDAVATRMIGKIRSQDLIRFLWNIVSHIRDREQEFQSDLAYTIGDLGVTRTQGRRVIDALFPDEQIDYELYQLERSADIPDDGAPFRYDDMLYFLCKLEANLMNAWGTNTLTTESSMIVSYDDFGAMVGFDADLQPFSKAYPYEGNLVYSIKTDENWQRLHTAHGELQVKEKQRVVGDLNIQFGESIDGVKASHFVGQADLVNQETGSVIGFGVNSALDFALHPDENGEAIEGSVDLLINMDGQSLPVVSLGLSTDGALTDLGLALTGALDVAVIGMDAATVNVGVECVEYDEAPYEGGQAVELSAEMTQEQLDAIKDAVKKEAAGMAVKFALKPNVLGNVMTLLGGFAE